ncbi:peptide ABC transporter substrate-binding protein [Ligilactobacillus saerimneri]|uniref:peptide ABC transporter substrate-binding protein n=1 Tax=Ligilactobacillus saerimneri TaxID=228229 RepID=UPI001C120B1E|nr:peptide ABC transporter substrate-binding protein [Ligilactobacillus saerimneri]MBU5309583.1 peptide ABC transporter substrate-binding protein [Ligilactobacillus saerimneri]
MKLKKVAAAGSVVFLSALALAACGNKSADSSKQVFNFSETGELPGMDLSKATDTISFTNLANTMEGLYRIGKDSKIEPGVAKKTEVSNDGKTYTFYLRKSKWSNGDPVTAKDFVYSWRRTLDPKTASQYSYLFDGVQNANDIIEGKKAPDTLGIKAEGDYKLVVNLEKPIPYFKLLMGFPVFFPQNQKAVDKFGSKYATASDKLYYNGPFKMTGWTGSNLSWKLQKNNSYWDKKNVHLDSVNYQVNKSGNTRYNKYKQGSVDYVTLETDQAKNLKNNADYHLMKDSTLAYLEFNEQASNPTVKKALSNKKIRQALSMAINRDQYVKTSAFGSQAAPGIVPDGLAVRNGKDFNSNIKGTGVTSDAKEAKKLWKEGLAEIGEKKLTLNLLGDDTDAAKKSGDFMQSNLETTLPGLKVNVQNVPFKTRLARSSSGDFDVVLTLWGDDFADPISTLDLFTSDNSQNDGKWKNSEYDSLIKASKTTDANDPAKRWDDLQKAQKILLEDQAVAPIYQRRTPYLVKSKVKGLIINSVGVTYNFKNVQIK